MEKNFFENLSEITLKMIITKHFVGFEHNLIVFNMNIYLVIFAEQYQILHETCLLLLVILPDFVDLKAVSSFFKMNFF